MILQDVVNQAVSDADYAFLEVTPSDEFYSVCSIPENAFEVARDSDEEFARGLPLSIAYDLYVATFKARMLEHQSKR